MATTVYFPEGSVAQPFDPPQRSLVKIVDLLQGGGSGGGGGNATLIVSGDPGAGVGSVGDLAWDPATEFFYIKDANGWHQH